MYVRRWKCSSNHPLMVKCQAQHTVAACSHGCSSYQACIPTSCPDIILPILGVLGRGHGQLCSEECQLLLQVPMLSRLMALRNRHGFQFASWGRVCPFLLPLTGSCFPQHQLIQYQWFCLCDQNLCLLCSSKWYHSGAGCWWGRLNICQDEGCTGALCGILSIFLWT